MYKTPFIKKILFIVPFSLALLFYNIPSTASDKITIDNIYNDNELLREIANKIIAQQQPNQIQSIQDKLRSFHSVNAKKYWGQYNLSMVGDAQGKTITWANLVPQTSLTKQNLRALIGKTDNTFYTETEIQNIGTKIQEAVTHGTFGIGKKSNSFECVYNLSVPYGEVCTKDSETDKGNQINVKCQPANKIHIIFIADKFFSDIISSNDKKAWKAKNLIGTIDSLY